MILGLSGLADWKDLVEGALEAIVSGGRVNRQIRASHFEAQPLSGGDVLAVTCESPDAVMAEWRPEYKNH